MPTLKNISFFQYKNYKTASWQFQKRITCIYGQNGVGKTNILDAIYFLGYAKSYFGKKDAQLVQMGQMGMFVEGNLETEKNELRILKLIIRENGKKECRVNNEEVKRALDFIGHLPSVLIAPDDTQLITEGSEQRRKFMDGILCQTDANYMNSFLQYNKVLAQRNALLKNWEQAGGGRVELLDIYTHQLCEAACIIYPIRLAWQQLFVPMVQHLVNAIGNGLDVCTIKYYNNLNINTLGSFVEVENNINANFENATILKNKEQSTQLLFLINKIDKKLVYSQLQILYKQSIEKDIILRRTNVGPHKDDLLLELHGNLYKEYASQGQRKTLLFALKIAQFYYLQQALGCTPLLLLDDVFEKLDAQRSHLLLQLIAEENCQTFITDTHLPRLQAALQGVEAEVEFLCIEE